MSATVFVSAVAASVEVLTGIIVANDDDSQYVTFQYKKPRSSKYIEETINKQDILAVYGNVGEEGSQLVRKANITMYSANGELEELDGGVLKVTPEGDSPTLFFPTEGVEIQVSRELAKEESAAAE